MKKEKNNESKALEKSKTKFLTEFFPEKELPDIYCVECFKKLIAELRRKGG